MKKFVNGEYIEMTAEEIAQIEAEAQREKLQTKSAEISDEEKLRLLLDSIPVEKPTDGNELPFKVGYKWEAVYNGNAFAWQLVADPDAIGTAERPIYWVDDGSIPLVENAYYIKDGVRHVYMAGQFIEF